MQNTPRKTEIRNLAISVLIALLPVIVVGSLFWRSSRAPEAVAVAPQQGSGSIKPANSESAGVKKQDNTTVALKKPDLPPVTSADILTKTRNIENENRPTERRRHISVLPDPQSKEPEPATLGAPNPSSQMAEHNEQHPESVVCEFKKFPFGVVEQRTYASKEMCAQAQKIWKDELRLLEPDGTINEKHFIRKEPPRIPGVVN